MGVSLAKCTVKRIVQASWNYLEGTSLKRAARGARGPQHQGEVGLYGREKELMDFKKHQASLSQIRETNSGEVSYRDPQKNLMYAPLGVCFTESTYSQQRTIAQVKRHLSLFTALTLATIHRGEKDPGVRVHMVSLLGFSHFDSHCYPHPTPAPRLSTLAIDYFYTSQSPVSLAAL